MLIIAEELNLVRFSLLIVGKERILTPFRMIDVPGSVDDYNVNCCHTDVSLSVRLFIL